MNLTTFDRCFKKRGSNLFMKSNVLPSMERVNVYLDFLPAFLGASPDGITERGSLVAITKVASKRMRNLGKT